MSQRNFSPVKMSTREEQCPLLKNKACGQSPHVTAWLVRFLPTGDTARLSPMKGSLREKHTGRSVKVR